MSLIPYEEGAKRGTKKEPWSQRDKRAVRHKIPGEERPVIDYNKLKQLCNIGGLSDINNPKSSADAHQIFMDNYKDMFVAEEKKTGIPIHTMNRCVEKSIQGSSTSLVSKTVMAGPTTLDNKQLNPSHPPAANSSDDQSHDIRDYLPLLHKQRRSEDPRAVRFERLKTLRKILRKLPFERTASENDQVYNAVRQLPGLVEQAPPKVLKELCVVAQLDAWKDPEITLFGNTGFHLIVRGSVKAQSDPYVKLRGEEAHFPCPTPEPTEDLPTLEVGDCFGTLEKVEGRDANSKILTVLTLEPNCEFLKITTSDYKRVMEQIRQRDETEKVNLLQSCDNFKTWSKQPLVKVSSLIEWVHFPANTVLVSEGYKAPFIAIIKSGECHVLRMVNVINTLPNKKQEKKTKQVVMGKLGQCTSFGEISIINDEKMTCSIVTATAVELACIEPHKLEDLDDITLQLLEQSSERTFGILTKDDIHDEYVGQELKREWNEFKHNAVVDVINSRGIRPGYGKWAK